MVNLLRKNTFFEDNMVVNACSRPYSQVFIESSLYNAKNLYKKRRKEILTTFFFFRQYKYSMEFGLLQVVLRLFSVSFG